jgi:DNA polymerase-3 subunit epsilon
VVDFPLTIVDVETTGTSALYHRIIEVAALRVEGGRIVKRFHSLVNPERFISPVIEGITGISNHDVAEAPRFGKIAGALAGILRDAVFVAHNARFDYSFLKNEFGRLGKPFNARTLCTVKLSRALFPQYRRHDLSSLIERHSLRCEGRHRAMGDALAVYDFLSMLWSSTEHERLDGAVRSLLRERNLPSGIDRAAVDELPETPGVYLFYGAGGELLYVGKSRNVRDRVLAHFSTPRESDLCSQITRIETQPTAGELGALLLELHLIKERRPIYNQVSRSKKPLLVVRKVVTREGYDRLVFADGDSITPANAPGIMAVFKNRSQANRFLVETAKKFALCQKMLGLENPRGHCFGYHLKRCAGACQGEEPAALHNARLEKAFARRRVISWPFKSGVLIQEKELTDGRGDAFLVDQWCLLSSYRFSDYGQGGFMRWSHTFDYDSYKVLAKYIADRRNRKHLRPLTPQEMESLVREGEPL